MAKAIHMMIRVLDEARSVAFYEKALGLKISDRYEFDNFTLVYLSNAESPFEVELTINHGRKGALRTGHGDTWARRLCGRRSPTPNMCCMTAAWRQD